MNLVKKKELRKEVLKLRDTLTKEERKEKSNQIAKRVIAMNEFKKANVILLYEAIRSEVETTAICEAAKQMEKVIYWPRVIGDRMEFYLVNDVTEFEISRFGIREPKMVEENRFVPQKQDEIMVVMPGVAFDEEGNRIGYGGGYYDKYLQWLEGLVEPCCIYKIGVAFKPQIVKVGQIETEVHDVRADYVVWE